MESKNNQIDISVIIPTYNCGKYLYRCIDSILYQNINALEIIVVDDFSSDNTQYLLNLKYRGNDKVRVFYQEKNYGQGMARNVGIEKSIGKYIFFIDADDWLDCGALEFLLSVAKENRADITTFGSRKVYENNNATDYHKHSFSCSGGVDALKYFSDYKIASTVWDKLYLRDFIISNNLRFNNLFGKEDVIFTIKAIFNCNRIVSNGRVFYNYFQRSDSCINQTPKLAHLISFIGLYSEMIKFFKEINIHTNSYGKDLCYKLLKSHCSNEVTNRIINYKRLRSKKEWEKECKDACENILGIDGYAVADLLVSILDNNNTHIISSRKNYINNIKNKIKFIVFSPKKFFIKYSNLLFGNKSK